MLEGMKVAISIEENLLKRVDALATEWRMPRSRVFALAAEELILKHENREMLEALDRVYGEESDEDEARKQARRQAHRRQVEGTW